jgi:FG-GAP-like repeat
MGTKRSVHSGALFTVAAALFGSLLGASGAFADPPAVRGDFNHDGHPDILWRHQSSHRLSVWYMDGSQRIGGELFMNPPEAGWTVVGTNDFNNDGENDIVWRNVNSGRVAIWYMNGFTHVGGQLVDPPDPTMVDLDWVFVGTGDFNGDGQADMFWRNNALGIFQGYLRIWEMQAATPTTPASVIDEEETIPDERTDLDWKIAGIADMTTDGQANMDILWRHAPTNALEIWRMNHFMQVATLPIVPAPGVSYPGPDWIVAGLFDLDADGKTDILWHNQVTGELRIWFMDDVVMLGQGPLNPAVLPDLQWKNVGPR